MLRLTAASLAALFLLPLASLPAASPPSYQRTEDVIYARKDGTALTLDVFQPKQNGKGVGIIFIVSGGWFSARTADGSASRFADLLARGYTVFAVVHGSNPRFSIPEILQDVHRAVRFVRYHAADYGIDPDRLGITGQSAGGHLSLMQATAGDLGRADAKDPIDRVSSRVQAVACFYPPTDFLNYGQPGADALGRGTLWNYAGAFSFTEYDADFRRLRPITDETRLREIGRAISPITHVTADDPPTLIFHGDQDWLVPLQQSQTFAEKLRAAGVGVQLVIKPGVAHGWPDMRPEHSAMGDWFDTHLAGIAGKK